MKKIHSNPNVPSVCYIKNIIKNPNIIVGDYTYHDDYETNGEDFENQVTHFYPFIGDKLIIVKFCAIEKESKLSWMVQTIEWLALVRIHMLCVMLKSTKNLFYESFYCANFEI